MTRPRDARDAAADLPSFLGDARPQSRELGGISGAPARRRAAADSRPHDREERDPLSNLAHGAPYEDDAYQYGEGDPAASAAREPRQQRASLARADGVAAMIIGAVIVLAGVAHWIDPGLTHALSEIGGGAASLVTVGVVVLSSGFARHQLGRLQRQLKETEQLRARRDEEIWDRLDVLLEGGAVHAGSDQRLEHVMLALQRQDQKINNLTKATKMYGKPLMEVATQTAEIAGTLERSTEFSANSSPDLAAAVAKLDTIAVATVAVRRQLEDGSQKLDSVIEQLRTDGSLMNSQVERQAKIADLVSRIEDDVQHLRRDDVESLEACIREVQREVAALATVTSRTKDVGSENDRSADEQPQIASGKAPPTETASSSGYAAGARKSGGQTVLGAIAKLKQLKG